MTTHTIQEAQAHVDALRARFQSYDGGDRPMSPPARLIRELAEAERRLWELRLDDRSEEEST